MTFSRNEIQAGDMVYPSNVLHGPTVTHNVGHSAAFPVWLPSFFIKLFTLPGDVVLDPFMGSGSTALAAHHLGRKWIGFDLSPESCEAASVRLAEAVARPRLQL